MTDETLDNETITPPPEVRRLRWIEDDNGAASIALGSEIIASCSDDQVAHIARMVMKMPARMSSLAWIGAGTAIGPRLCKGRMTGGALQDVYEIRQRIVDKLRAVFPAQSQTWNFIVGDWRQALTGTYDVIVYDVPGEPDVPLLQAHLNQGGLLLGT